MNPQRYKWNNWNEIDWKTVEISVFKLQKRIYKASQRGDNKAVHKLQRLLTTSYFGRLWASRRVTQDNQGKKTAGIDGIHTLRPKQRFHLAKNLRLNGKSKPTRRVWIPKPNGEQRPLGIPTIEERAKQALLKLALEPQWEYKFEDNSYGFRPTMSGHDAIEAIYNSICKQPKYVLDADISKCFDKINQDKLLAKLETHPKIRRQVSAWLKSGVIDKSWSPTNEGTPQGGVISPLLANIALHGMENELKRFAETLDMKGKNGFQIPKKDKRSSLSIIRYADDFVILHKEVKVILKCKQIIENWLGDIGLQLKPEKTRISHTLFEYENNVGFDFLGFNIRQYPIGKHNSGTSTRGETLGFKTLIKPSKDKTEEHIKKIKNVIKRHECHSQILLIRDLNPIIRGWSNYYKTVCSKETFNHCDHILYLQLASWATKRHPNKNKKWIRHKYWHKKDNNNYLFSVKERGEIVLELTGHSETKIVRHTKVKSGKSFFDGDLVYWSTRMGKHPEMPTAKAKMLKFQKGKCNYCQLHFRDGDKLEIDHIIPKSKGGGNEYKNLQLLHKHCHDNKTATDGSLENLVTPKIKAISTCIHDREFIKEERCEVKVSRTVLKTSGSGDASA